MPRRLKVFRTPIGFHDALVAAPSRKAALAAWGADADLFARGVAEEITDARLTAEPLAHPGEVIRVARGTAEEHLAALPPTPRRRKKPASMAEPKCPPRPSRADLDAAEAAIDRADKAHKALLRELSDREATIARERRAAERDYADEVERLEAAKDDARIAYDRAIAQWRQ